MRTRAILIIIGLTFSLPLSAKWERVKIPIDSLWPVELSFYDSLYGIFCGYTWTSTPPDSFHPVDNGFYRTYWFRTTNGGKQWERISFEGLAPNDRIDSGHGASPILTVLPKILLPDNHTIYLITPIEDDLEYHVLRSTDRGKTWGYWATWDFIYDDYFLAGAIATNQLLFTDKSGNLLYAFNSSDPQKFVLLTESLKEYLHPVDGASDYAAVSDFAMSDANHWTLLARANDISLRSADTTSLIPFGMRVFMSESGGFRWEETALVPIAGERYFERFTGDLIAIRNSPYRYVFSLQGGYEGCREGYSGDANFEFFNINYLSSSDYGKTWNIAPNIFEPGERRRAYEALRENELWITTTNRAKYGGKPALSPAYIILKTTDNGLTWSADSTTLMDLESGPYDGRIITFSDPQHGWIAAMYDMRSTYIFRYTADEQLGAEDPPLIGMGEPRMRIYPNPADEETTVVLRSAQTIERIDIVDMLGRAYDLSYAKEKNTALLNTSSLEPGYYFCRAKHAQGVYTRALAVQRK